MKSYLFSVIVEADGDKWSAHVPELEAWGAASWGYTKDEALRNIQEVAQMVIEDMLADGQTLPRSIVVSDQPRIAVNV